MAIPRKDIEQPINESRGAVPIKDPSKRRKCPLCANNLHLYYINHIEMFLMCEKESCDFPFGYEPLQIVYNESQLVDNPEPAENGFFEYPIGGLNGVPNSPLMTNNTSTIQSSVSDWDQNSVAGDLDPIETLSIRLYKESKKRKLRKDVDIQLNSRLQSIKKLTEEMNDLDYKKKHIKNEKWLNNLKMWEGHSGLKLLKDEEKQYMNKNPEFALGELKITVDPYGQVPSLDIHISNPSNSELMNEQPLDVKISNPSSSELMNGQSSDMQISNPSNS